jgi:uncharacterized protein
MTISIRDPIHGSIALTPSELKIVDHRVFQRLRGIKQLGFTDQAFPGATHTRYAHGIGAMHVVSRMFDAIFPVDRNQLPRAERGRMRQTLRLALLLHDLGHAPGSHASECAMPQLEALGLCEILGRESRKATHEDYTLKLLLESDLSDVIKAQFGHMGIDALDIAHLIGGAFPKRNARFTCGGVDYFPLLTQLVSGEMDADRMDYLQRDSFFTGVAYGNFDQTWLLENLSHHIEEKQAFLALEDRAIFAFEDFLLSRYHMFVSVYLHYISVGIETMLKRFYDEAPGDFSIPADVESYIQTDDIALWSALRSSSNRWAQRIANRQTFRRLVEFTSSTQVDVAVFEDKLNREGVEYFLSRDKGILSKNPEQRAKQPIFVHERDLKRTRQISDRANIFRRYEQPIHLTRLYVDGKDLKHARSLIDALPRP